MPKQIVVFPSDWWIAAWLRGQRPTVLFVPMKPQPPEGYTKAAGRDVWACGPFIAGVNKPHEHWSPPGWLIEPGDTLLCKETLQAEREDAWPDYAVYSADGKAVLSDYARPLEWRWQHSHLSPAQMPREAIRIKPVVTSVAAQWMPDVSEDDAGEAGFVNEQSEATGRPLYRPMLREAWIERYDSWDMWAWRIGVVDA